MIKLKYADDIKIKNSSVKEIKLNNEIIYKNSKFYVEYTVDNSSDLPLNTIEEYHDSNGETFIYYLGLPVIKNSIEQDSNSAFDSNFNILYDKVVITLLNGEITEDLSTPMSNISKIKIWYPEDTVKLQFISLEKSHYIKTLKYINTKNFNKMNYMFYNCRSLNSLDLSNFDTSNVTTMRSMFYNCRSLTSLDLSSFNTSNVTSMGSMFENCKSLTSLDLSSFNTSNVTSMDSMFGGCSSLTSLDLSSFNTSNVTSYSYMLYNVSKTVNWNYNRNKYQKWNLTESQTNYSGKFPWNE